MASIPPLRTLFFDVFGTCVAQRGPVADALSKAAKEALESNTASISSDVRARATQMTYDDWFELGGEWNIEEDRFASECKAKSGNVDWVAVDEHRLMALYNILVPRGLIISGDEAPKASKVHVKEGSLWNALQLKELCLVWRRLTPWPDTCRGLELLNTKYSTVALSNTYNELLQGLVSYSNIPFTHVYSSDMFQSYKPNPKVYLGAAEKLGVKPEEYALVASHLNDLKGAKACGFYAIYCQRPLEEKTPELLKEGIPDLVIEEDEGGFEKVAERLGIRST